MSAREMREHHPFGDARGAGCEKDVGEIIIYHRDGRVLAGLLRKVIGKGERGQRQRSLRRLIDEVDSIHWALVMKRTAQLLIKLMTRDQRAKRALTTNLLEPRTGGIGIHRHIARPGLHDSKDGGDRGGRFVQINTDPISARNTVCDQAVRNLVTKPIQLTRVSGSFQESHRLVLRLTSGGFCQQLVKSESHGGSLTEDRLASPVAPFGCQKKLVSPVSSDAN